MGQTTDIDKWKGQLIAALEAELVELEAQATALDEKITEKEDALETVKKALKDVKSAPQPVGEKYYVHSRSGDTDGHFIEYGEGILTCSCPGFQYNGKCWASTFIRGTVGRAAYRYASGANPTTNFSRRVKPMNPNIYLPYNARNMHA